MDVEIIKKLNRINQRFYKKAAHDFSDSRKYYWQGWREFLPYIENMLGEKEILNVLDVGCGNGRFGSFLVDNLPSIEINYTGIDNSQELLEIAKEKLSSADNLNLTFKNLDIVESLLENKFLETDVQSYDIIVMFGVLHHIPTYKLRKRLITELSKKVTPTGLFIFTLWRFLDNKRLERKLVEYEKAALKPSQLEENDFILSWDRKEKGYRYGHYTDQTEENLLREASKLHLVTDFESDGKEGKGNKYLVLSKSSGV